MFSKKTEPPSCYGCGCLLAYVTKRVVVQGCSPDGPLYFNPVDTTRHFCGKCAPPYDLIRLETVNTGGFWKERAHYYKHQPDIEVTEQGKRLKEAPDA